MIMQQLRAAKMQSCLGYWTLASGHSKGKAQSGCFWTGLRGDMRASSPQVGNSTILLSSLTDTAKGWRKWASYCEVWQPV